MGKSLKEDDARFVNIPLDQFCGSTQFLHQFEYILEKVEENIFQIFWDEDDHLKTSLREWLVCPMDDRVVGTEVDALQDVLLRSLVLNIVLVPDDDHNDHDDDCDEYIILSTEVYLSVVVYVAPNLNNWSNYVSLHQKM